MVKADELVGGAVLGVAVTELFRFVTATYKKATTFKNRVEQLKENLQILTKVVEELRTSNICITGKPNAEILIEEARPFVGKCSTVGTLNLFKIMCCSSKLDDQHRKISKSLEIIQAEKIAKVLAVRESRVGPHPAADDRPKITVGLGVPLNEIKTEVLMQGMQVIVVSAPGGFGKTTLVRNLCEYPDIKAKFKDNIFFVEVSENPNLKLIVEKIYKYKTHLLPEFREEEAVRHLEELLKRIGKEPILLVFDNVWSGLESESMLQNLERLQLPDCKILVTSRYKFPRFRSRHNLEPLNEGDATKLFRQLAIVPEGNSYKPDETTVNKIVKACKGSPKAITVAGRSLLGKPAEFWNRRVKKWTQVANIFLYNDDILNCLQSSLHVLDDVDKAKDCFMDLGSFSEDQMIPVNALIDMWSELYYQLDVDLDMIICNLYALSHQSLVNFVVPSENTSVDDCYDDYFVKHHGILRDMIIHLNNSEPPERRERIFIEIKSINDLERWRLDQREQPVNARLMSISSDENFSSNWFDMEAPNVEVVVLTLRSENYTLPDFIGKMNKTKVLLVTNNGSYHSELNNFQLLGLLPDLRRIRLENVSIPSDMTTMQMENLQKISLIKCNVGQLFGNSDFNISYTCPNLKDIDIGDCDDLMQLPDGLCDIVSIIKLSITNCPGLSALPERIDGLVNLEVLKLTLCINLVALPNAVGNLSKLKTLCMKGCVNCRIPTTIMELQNLEIVKEDNSQ